MDSQREISIRPLASFDEHVANATADRIRKFAQDASALSWELDEALRRVRRAETAEDKAEAMRALEATHVQVNRKFTLLGF